MRPDGYNLTLAETCSKDKTKSLGEISPNLYQDMPDRIWETHVAFVGVCNSLNAIRGTARNEYIRKLLERAQSVIVELLDETGRSEEYFRWLDEYETKKEAKSSE